MGHLDEYHYISTLPIIANLVENNPRDLQTSKEEFLTDELTFENVKKSRNSYMNYMREYMKNKRLNKDPQNKKKNNEYMREYMKNKRLNKDPQNKKKNNEYMREYRKTKRLNKDTKNNEYMKVYMKNKRLNKDLQNKKKNNEYMNEYRAKKLVEPQTLQCLISKFHDAVSKGPLYICSCCSEENVS